MTTLCFNIVVDPLRAGEGIGKALIHRVEKECRARDIPVLKLATHAKMLKNNLLYEHLGWIETGREGNKVLMSKEL